MKTKKCPRRAHYLAHAFRGVDKAPRLLRPYMARFYLLEAVVFSSLSPVVSASIREQWEHEMCKAGYATPEQYFLPVDTPR